METFDPYANDGPIEYVVKTGDPSRGASMRDERILLDDGFDASYSSGETSSGSLTALRSGIFRSASPMLTFPS